MSDEVEQEEPTEEEIINYAKWLGLDPDADQDLLWIANEGIRAPLPSAWKPM
jgi:centrosomal protein CEP164